MKSIIMFIVWLAPLIGASQTLTKVNDIVRASITSVNSVTTLAKINDITVPSAGCQEPTFRAAADNESTSSATIVINKPTGTISGELMVAIINWNNTGTITPPSGWTEHNMYFPSSGGTMGLYYKVAGGSEPSDYTWSFDAASRVSGAIVTFQGSYASDPREGAYSENEDVFGDPTANTITTTNDCAIVLYLSAYDEPLGDTWTAPSGWSIATANDGTGNCVIGYKYFATAGATGNAAFTCTNASAAFGNYLWAFIRND